MYRAGGPAARSKLAVSAASDEPEPDGPEDVGDDADEAPEPEEPPPPQAARTRADAPSTVARRRDLTASYKQARVTRPTRSLPPGYPGYAPISGLSSTATRFTRGVHMSLLE